MHANYDAVRVHAATTTMRSETSDGGWLYTCGRPEDELGAGCTVQVAACDLPPWSIHLRTHLRTASQDCASGPVPDYVCRTATPETTRSLVRRTARLEHMASPLASRAPMMVPSSAVSTFTRNSIGGHINMHHEDPGRCRVQDQRRLLDIIAFG